MKAPAIVSDQRAQKSVLNSPGSYGSSFGGMLELSLAGELNFDGLLNPKLSYDAVKIIIAEVHLEPLGL